MAGTVVINGTSWWSAAGSVHDYILFKLSRQLKLDSNPELAGKLARAPTEITGYLNLERLSTLEFQIFAKALIQAFEEMEREGPASFKDPSGFPAYLERFRELVELIRADPRYKRP